MLIGYRVGVSLILPAPRVAAVSATAVEIAGWEHTCQSANDKTQSYSQAWAGGAIEWTRHLPPGFPSLERDMPSNVISGRSDCDMSA